MARTIKSTNNAGLKAYDLQKCIVNRVVAKNDGKPLKLKDVTLLNCKKFRKKEQHNSMLYSLRRSLSCSFEYFFMSWVLCLIFTLKFNKITISYRLILTNLYLRSFLQMIIPAQLILSTLTLTTLLFLIKIPWSKIGGKISCSTCSMKPLLSRTTCSTCAFNSFIFVT